jgi:hypothetical protein
MIFGLIAFLLWMATYAVCHPIFSLLYLPCFFGTIFLIRRSADRYLSRKRKGAGIGDRLPGPLLRRWSGR